MTSNVSASVKARLLNRVDSDRTQFGLLLVRYACERFLYRLGKSACLHAAIIQGSMDSRGRALDKIFCERLWRSVKYEDIYLKQYDSVRQLQVGLNDNFNFYSNGETASKSQLSDTG